MRPISRPPRASARIVACAPGPGLFWRFPPGPRTRTWTPSMPAASTSSATVSAICIAAYGDASSRFCLTTAPPDDLAIVSAPVWSVTVMSVLLNDACTWATPHLSPSFSAMLLLLRSFGVEFVRERTGLVELDGLLLVDLDLVGGDRHASVADDDVPVDDELARLLWRVRQSASVGDRLEATLEHVVDLQRQDIVEPVGVVQDAVALE